MTTIATQTDESIGELFRFRDVAEDTCSAEAVTDALMTQIEEKMDIIKTLEERVEYQDIQLKKYNAIEEDKGLSNRGPKYLEEYIEEILADKDHYEERLFYLSGRVDELQDEYDELDESSRGWAAERDEAEKKCEKLKEWVDRNQEEINRLRDVIDEDTSQAVISMLKDENEVNKKNMFKFMKENKELREKIKTMLCQ